jgi:hypothetical protein
MDTPYIVVFTTCFDSLCHHQVLDFVYIPLYWSASILANASVYKLNTVFSNM